MESVIRELDPIRLTVPLRGEEAGNREHLLDLPVGTEGTALIDWGDAFECLLAVPDPNDPDMPWYVEMAVRLDQMERLPLPPDHASGR
jgi:hypothetical protein